MNIEQIPLSNFLLCKGGFETGNPELILSTETPFWYCQVFKFPSREGMHTFLDENGYSDVARIMAHYNIAFVLMGMLSTAKKVDIPTENLLAEMGNFYAIEMTGQLEDFFSYKEKAAE